MKRFAISLVSSILTIGVLAWSQASRAQGVPLIFQTTFNIPEWIQTPGRGDSDAQLAPDGDGISGSGGWTTSNGSRDQVTTGANNPAGGGGRGFRHWVGDGNNNGGGGIVVQWAPVSEMWFRYYIRFQAGFRWSSSSDFMKTIYCNRGMPGTFYFGLHDGVIGGYVENDGRTHKSNVSFVSWQGGATGDGKFHALEVHAKMNTTGTSSDGVLEYWLDGTKIYSSSTVKFSNTTGARFTNCAVGENHYAPQNGADAYVDFDDIAVSAVGHVGTLGSPGAGLTPPSNLRVQ